MNDRQVLSSEKRSPDGDRSNPDGLERLTGYQKVAGLLPGRGSEIFFLRIELDDRSSIITNWNYLGNQKVNSPHWRRVIKLRLLVQLGTHFRNSSLQ